MSPSLLILVAEDPKSHPVLTIPPVALLKVVFASCSLDAASTSPLSTFSALRSEPTLHYASYRLPLEILHDLDTKKACEDLLMFEENDRRICSLG